MTDYRALIKTFANSEVKFIIIGGAAAIAHGSSRLTEDLDLVYQREPDNIGKLIAALAPHQPYPRDAPAGLPFQWDEETISRGLNFALTTSLGAVDLLGEIILGGGYEELLPHSIPLQIFGHECLCLGLERLIQVKRAAGRPKDFEAIAELENILQERTR
jgi:predicted nucleotidyltransferase